MSKSKKKRNAARTAQLEDTSFEADGEALEDIKSRSQIKREMEALQNIGKKLCELKPSQLSQIPISEDLEAGITAYLKISSNEAKRRQLQYIGKLMRSEDIDSITEVLDRFDSSSDIYAKRLHVLEAWRTRLVEEGNETLTEFVERVPSVDVQALRQLVRSAKKDQQSGKNTGSAKKLFRLLKQHEEELLD